MASCDYCGSMILFGGKKIEGLRFCNDKCLANGHMMIAAGRVPDEVVTTRAREIHVGPCPVCGDQGGPVDVHTSHKVASFLVMTSWSSTPRVSCSSCARKAQLGGLAYSLFLGWWGIPWGIFMTPVQIGKNVVGMFRSNYSSEPSDKLKNIVRLQLASASVAASQRAPG
jgi:ribosomal protein L24E